MDIELPSDIGPETDWIRLAVGEEEMLVLDYSQKHESREVARLIQELGVVCAADFDSPCG